MILTVTPVCMCCKKLYSISFLYPILFGSLWYLANKHKLPHWCFAAEQASCSWKDLLGQMGDLQMLEEQGAELAMAHLREISIHYRLLIFIKAGTMVSLLCCQSEPRVSWERQCHNICFDCEQHCFYVWQSWQFFLFFLDSVNMYYVYSHSFLCILMFEQLKLNWLIFVLCH